MRLISSTNAADILPHSIILNVGRVRGHVHISRYAWLLLFFYCIFLKLQFLKKDLCFQFNWAYRLIYYPNQCYTKTCQISYVLRSNVLELMSSNLATRYIMVNWRICIIGQTIWWWFWQYQSTISERETFVSMPCADRWHIKGKQVALLRYGGRFAGMVYP